MSNALSLKTVIIDITDITVDEGFFSPLPEDKLEELAESIRSIGLIYPIVVVKSNGKYKIVDGRNRYKALTKIGAREVPAIVLNDINEFDDQVKKLLEIELELLRRHSREDILSLASQTRETILKRLKSDLIRKIETYTKLTCPDAKEILEKLTITDLIKINNTIEEMKKLNIPAILIEAHIKEKIITARGEKQQDDKTIEKYEKELRKKEEIIAELSNQLLIAQKELSEKSKQVKELEETLEAATKRYQDIYRKMKEQIQEELRKKEEELERKRKELLEKGGINAEEEIEAILEEERARILEEFNKKKSYYEETIKELRAQIDDLQRKIIKSQNEVESKNEIIKELENKITYLTAEKEKLRTKIDSLRKITETIANPDNLIKQLQIVRKNTETVINYLTNFENIQVSEEDLKKIEITFEDTEAVITTMIAQMKNWISNRKKLS